MGNKDIHRPFHKLLLKKHIFSNISSKDEKRLEKHLEECDFCRNDLKKIMRNNQVLSSEVIQKVSEGFKDKVLEKLNIPKTAAQYKFLPRKKQPLWSRAGLAAACLPILFASLFTFQMFRNELGKIDKSKVNPEYKTFLNQRKYFRKIKPLNKNINDEVKRYLKEKNIKHKDFSSEVFTKYIPMKKISKKGYSIILSSLYTVINISKKDINKIKINRKNITKNIKRKFGLESHKIILRIKPPVFLETNALYILLIIIILELIVRLLMILDIKKQKKGKSLYIFTLLLVSLFVPIYLFLRRKYK